MSHIFRRSFFKFFPKSTSPYSTTLITQKPDPVTQINSILSKSKLIEPELDKIINFISRNVVQSLIVYPPSTRSGCRLYIWACNHPKFRIWELKDVLIRILLRENNGFDIYWETLEEIRKCGINVPADAFLVLISGYYEAGKAEKAVESFGKMSDFDCKPNVFVYNAILNVMVRKDAILLALAVYSKMLKLSCCPDVATYTILIDGLCKSGEVEDAIGLFDEMSLRGIMPNTITFTVVLLALCQAERANEARALLGKMTRVECLPDEITWNGVLAGFCRMGKVDEALLLLNVFGDKGYVLGVNGYSSIIDGLFKVKRFEDANKWFDKMIKAGITPDVVIYTIMIQGYCETGRVRKARKLFRQMTKKGIVPDTQCYNMLIKGYCDAGYVGEAQSLRLEISKNDCFPDTNTSTILISTMCKKGMVGKANKLFEEMEKLGCLPSVETFNALIDGLFKEKKLEEARLMFYKMEIGRNPSLFLRLSLGTDRVMDKASLNNVVTRLCESGLYLKAYTLISKLADNGPLPNIVTYNVLIDGLCSTGNMDGAFKIFKTLRLKGVSPDAVTYGTLVNGLFKAKREEEGMKMVEEMMKSGVSPSRAIYRSLMTWLCRRRKVLTSFNLWLNYLKRFEKRDVHVINLIEEHFEKGEVEEAVRGLLKMDFNTGDFDLAPYTIWLIGFCQAKRLDDALKIFHVLQELNVTVTAPSCVKLITACCYEKKLDTAANVFLYAVEKGATIIPRVRNLLLCSMFGSGPHVNRAISLLKKLDAMGFKDISPKTKSPKLIQDIIDEGRNHQNQYKIVQDIIQQGKKRNHQNLNQRKQCKIILVQDNTSTTVPQSRVPSKGQPHLRVPTISQPIASGGESSIREGPILSCFFR